MRKHTDHQGTCSTSKHIFLTANQFVSAAKNISHREKELISPQKIFYTANKSLYRREKYFMPRKRIYIAAKKNLCREKHFISPRKFWPVQGFWDETK